MNDIFYQHEMMACKADAESRVVRRYKEKQQLPKAFKKEIEAHGVVFDDPKDENHVLLPSNYTIETAYKYRHCLLLCRDNEEVLRFGYNASKWGDNDYWSLED